jgi:hypothetical protein
MVIARLRITRCANRASIHCASLALQRFRCRWASVVNVRWKLRIRSKPAKSKYELTAENILKPEVAQHVANAIVTSGMDYETAIPKALPETRAEDLGHTINIAKQSPVVQAAIQDRLKKRGLDSDSREYHVKKLWEWFESRQPAEERKTLQAARILGEVFIKANHRQRNLLCFVSKESILGLRKCLPMPTRSHVSTVRPLSFAPRQEHRCCPNAALAPITWPYRDLRPVWISALSSLRQLYLCRSE